MGAVGGLLGRAAPAGPGAVSGTPAAAPAAPATVAGAAGQRGDTAMTAVSVLAAIGGVIVAVVGFTGSYRALVDLAEKVGLGWFSYAFPVGVDAAIVVLLALDLHLIRKQTPWPVLRLMAHLMTAATIWFNASSGHRPVLQDPTGAAVHAVIPIGFILAVEAARRLVIRAVRLETGHGGSVPLHRWLLAPRQSWQLYRRMRLWAIPSYTQALALEQERVVYRELLDRDHGSWRKAPADARLPLTMAPYGLSVDQALALPQQAAEAERLRAEQQEEWAAEAAERAAQRAARTRIAQLRADTSVEAAEAEATAQAGTARARAQAVTATAQAEADAATVQAEAAATAAVRAAALETEALDTAAAAEAKARAAEAEERAAEARARAAETDERAAETEERAAEARARAAEHDARTAEAEARSLEAEAAQAEALARADEAKAGAAEARRRAAEREARALEAEDAARLTPRERAARKVARMILSATPHGHAPDPEAVDLQTIADAFGVSSSTASAYRTEAAALLADGYRPAA
ncbi:DUF2637 domain-containing protein [Kitasatospora sp. NPDC018058]|uniref:DUF2637 domain-containing protein n=1 Tax=Kitasatospora sp. NPDC018058 TaxID=3364025 RepID=UPI0037C0290F